MKRTDAAPGSRGRCNGRAARIEEAGFSLLEMVVTISIMAILAAIIAVETTPQLPAARAASLEQSLGNVRNALNDFAAPTSVNSYPDSLDKLVKPVDWRATPAPKNLCGSVIDSISASRWNGPYLSQNLLAEGLPIGSSIISSRVEYASTANPPQVRLVVTGVDSIVAFYIERKLDMGTLTLTPNFTAGNILWTADSPGGTGRGTLRFSFPATPACP